MKSKYRPLLRNAFNRLNFNAMRCTYERTTCACLIEWVCDRETFKVEIVIGALDFIYHSPDLSVRNWLIYVISQFWVHFDTDSLTIDRYTLRNHFIFIFTLFFPIKSQIIFCSKKHHSIQVVNCDFWLWNQFLFEKNTKLLLNLTWNGHELWAVSQKKKTHTFSIDWAITRKSNAKDNRFVLIDDFRLDFLDQFRNIKKKIWVKLISFNLMKRIPTVKL